MGGIINDRYNKQKTVTVLDSCIRTFIFRRINSRLIRISFESIEQQLIGKDRAIAEMNVRQAASNAYRSIGVITAYIQQCINTCKDDPNYFDIVNNVEDVCEQLEGKPIAQRVRDVITLQLYCVKKVGKCDLIKILLNDNGEKKELMYLHVPVVVEYNIM